MVSHLTLFVPLQLPQPYRHLVDKTMSHLQQLQLAHLQE